MDALWIMLKNVILFVALAVPGYLLVKCKVLKGEQSGVLSKVLMYLGVPFMVLAGTLKVQLNGTTIKTVLLVAGLTIVFLALSFVATVPITRMEEGKKRGMMRFCAMFSNNGFLGIPLAQAVFGAGTTAFMTVIVINVLTNIAMFTIGVYLISGDKNTISIKKALLNPVLIAFLLGIVLNLVDIGKLLPEAVTYSNHFSGIVTPLSMTILGMKMGEIQFLGLFKSWKTYYVSLWKLVVFPVVISAILLGIHEIFPTGLITEGVILGTFVAFATPTAGLSSTFADGYEGDSEGAVAYTLGSTVLSVATISVFYWLLTLCL